ncbi:MAG: SOS response-associated peptidase, partial [Methanosarcinaceae archaeon]|nr:SOS response-associated peptidase [Methanosarcinaceae archaeon]
NAVPIITKKGNVGMGLWNGFARIETLKNTWISKGWQPVKIINGTGFKERDTVSGSKELKEFGMKQGSTIAAVAKVIAGTNDRPCLEVKMVTQAAKGKVKEVHHRMPVIIEE